MKQEPSAYAWSAFARDGRTSWTGVRNFQARNNLRAMRVGDAVAYYHSREGLEVVGLARVERAAYPDPTATEGDWVCVDLVPDRALPRPVSLEAIKADPVLREMALVKQSRLSVMPLTAGQLSRLRELGGIGDWCKSMDGPIEGS